MHHREVIAADSQKVVEKTVSASKRFVRKEDDIKDKWQDKRHSVFPLPGCLDTQDLGTRKVKVWVHRTQKSLVPGQSSLHTSFCKAALVRL